MSRKHRKYCLGCKYNHMPCNNPELTENEKLYDKFSGTMGVKRRIDSPLSLNPYDNHFSYLENLIVWISLFLSLIHI